MFAISLTSVNVGIFVALITGAVSLLVSLSSIYFGQRNQRSLELLKAQLAERNSAEAARREYQYEALKRLYAQVEPVLFQLCEALEEAHYRVRSLARTSRAGSIHWMASEGIISGRRLTN